MLVHHACVKRHHPAPVAFVVHATMDAYLQALGRKFNEDVEPATPDQGD